MTAHAVGRALTRRVDAGSAARQAAAGLLVAAVSVPLTVVIVQRATLAGAAVAIVVAGSLWLASTRHTAVGLAVVMLYLGLLDGYLKLATGSNYVTFVRDVLLYALAAGVLVRAVVAGRRLPLPPLSGWVLAFAVLVLVQLLNPGDGTLIHSIAGVRQHLEFVPLFFLTYAFVRTVRSLRGFVILLAVIAVANGIAGYVQFNETPQQFAAWGPGYSQRVLGSGIFAASGRNFANASGVSSTRPFGLGSDSADGGLFGLVALGGILALASLYRRWRYLVPAIIGGAGATVAIITSQGRSVVIAGVLTLVWFGLLAATSRRDLRGVVRVVLAAAIAGTAAVALLGSAGTGLFRYGGLGPAKLVNTVGKSRGKTFSDIPRNFANYPLGAGLATAGPAAGSPGGSSVAGTVDAETEFSYLTVETGIPGMITLIGFTVALVVLGWRRCREEPDREARLLLAAIIAPLGALLTIYFAGAPTSSVPLAPYLWAAGGILSYWLVALPKARKREAARAGAAQDRERAIPAIASPKRTAHSATVKS
jgi:hypothetical protein